LLGGVKDHSQIFLDLTKPKIFNRPERLFGHIKTETRFKLLVGSAVENIWAMNESLTQQCLMSDEGA